MNDAVFMDRYIKFKCSGVSICTSHTDAYDIMKKCIIESSMSELPAGTDWKIQFTVMINEKKSRQSLEHTSAV